MPLFISNRGENNSELSVMRWYWLGRSSRKGGDGGGVGGGGGGVLGRGGVLVFSPLCRESHLVRDVSEPQWVCHPQTADPVHQPPREREQEQIRRGAAVVACRSEREEARREVWICRRRRWNCSESWVWAVERWWPEDTRACSWRPSTFRFKFSASETSEVYFWWINHCCFSLSLKTSGFVFLTQREGSDVISTRLSVSVLAWAAAQTHWKTSTVGLFIFTTSLYNL